MIQKIKEYQFLLEELVKRDFKKKYKGTVLGMLWSVLNPLLTLLIMRLVFTHFFGGGMEHYTTFLFCGNIIFSYFISIMVIHLISENLSSNIGFTIVK